MTPIPARDMPRIVDERDAKTREIPRPEPASPGPLGFGWERKTIDYGDDGAAVVYTQPDAIVTRSAHGLDVEAIDSPEVHRQLAYLFAWIEGGGR